jgi:VWFA-related protein
MSARCLLLVPLLVIASLPQQTPVLRSQSNVVLVPTMVKDASGEIVYGLTAGDFVIEDDGVEQPARLDDAAESDPISLVLAVQTGRRAKREFSRMQGLNSLLNPVFDQPGSRVALLEFDKRISVVSDFTEHQQPIKEALQRLEPGDNGAAIVDVVRLAANLLNKEPEGRRRLLLLVSETRDHGSHLSTIDDAVAAVASSNTVVHVLAFSPSLSQVLDNARGSNSDEWDKGTDLLAPILMARQAMRKNTARTIAQFTGGEYESFASRNAFEGRLVDFTNHVHSRYLLTFEPRRPHPGLHHLRVRLKEPRDGFTVVSRTAYWALGNGSMN